MGRDHHKIVEKKKHKKKSKVKKEKKKKNKREKSDQEDSKLKSSTVSDSKKKEKHDSPDNIDEKNREDSDLQRDSWMSLPFDFKTVGKQDLEKDKGISETSSSGKSVRDLDASRIFKGRSGLFKKPSENSLDQLEIKEVSKVKNWQKRINLEPTSNPIETTESISATKSSDVEIAPKQYVKQNVNYLKEMSYGQQINALSAKILKAQIMGNTELSTKLAEKLEELKNLPENVKMLMQSDDSANRRSLHTVSDSRSINRNEVEKRKREHVRKPNERVRSFLENEKYDIKSMFQREKCTSSTDSNWEFINMTKNSMKDEDLEETAENVVQKRLKYSMDLHRGIDDCRICLDSPIFEKKFVVSMGSSVYLSLPWHIGLQVDHCLLVPLLHTCASTYLDNDAWQELTHFRQSLVKMFAAQGREVLFFEIAKSLKRKKHMKLHCVPIPKSEAELAPFYFKKAIDESEREWSLNNQLVTLKQKDVRNSIPKGLPYFWINFGMDYGFAHVIEEESRFPTNFAEEIIGGMLKLEASKWRTLRRELDIEQKRKSFTASWKKYENINTSTKDSN